MKYESVDFRHAAKLRQLDGHFEGQFVEIYSILGNYEHVSIISKVRYIRTIVYFNTKFLPDHTCCYSGDR